MVPPVALGVPGYLIITIPDPPLPATLDSQSVPPPPPPVLAVPEVPVWFDPDPFTP